MNIFCFESPLGFIQVTKERKEISAIDFLDNKPGDEVVQYSGSPDPLFVECRNQLNTYFEGSLQTFSLPLLFSGTVFQQKVWQQLLKIPYGQTISYQELAVRLGDPKCIRAAASANGKNPFSIVVPCHRVIGKDGSLTGYASGLWRKKWLLEHESSVAPGQTNGEARQLSLF